MDRTGNKMENGKFN